MRRKTNNPDTVFPFYLRTRCATGMQVKHMFRLEKGVDVFRLLLDGQEIQFAVINLKLFREEQVMDIVAGLDGKRVFEVDCGKSMLGIVFTEPDFIDDSVVEVPGVGNEVFYRYTLLVKDDMMIIEIRTGDKKNGKPVIDMACSRLFLDLPMDEHTPEEKAGLEEIDGRNSMVISVKLHPLTM